MCCIYLCIWYRRQYSSDLVQSLNVIMHETRVPTTNPPLTGDRNARCVHAQHLDINNVRADGNDSTTTYRIIHDDNDAHANEQQNDNSTAAATNETMYVCTDNNATMTRTIMIAHAHEDCLGERTRINNCWAAPAPHALQSVTSTLQHSPHTISILTSSMLCKTTRLQHRLTVITLQ